MLQELGDDVQIQLSEVDLPHRVLVSFVKQGRLCDRVKATLYHRYCGDPEVTEWLESSLADRVALMFSEDDGPSGEELELEVREKERVSWWNTLNSAERHVSKEEAASGLLYYFYDEYSSGSFDGEALSKCVTTILDTFSRRDIVNIMRKFLQKLYWRAGHKAGLELAGLFDRISKEDVGSLTRLEEPDLFSGEPLRVFTSELLDYLIDGPRWEMALPHALSDIQYTRVLSSLKQETRWYAVPLASSRSQALACMDAIESTHDGMPAQATMAGMQLARWVTGPDDPLLVRCLGVTNLQASRSYGLGLWRMASEEALLPADVEESIEKYEIGKMAKNAILELIGRVDFLDWHYQVVSRMPNGAKMLSYADLELGERLWQEFEAECGDATASALNLLLSGRGRLCDVVRTVRILEMAASS
jgi:hypothetical protein